jgi:CoA:oxalate CoA-transferase
MAAEMAREYPKLISDAKTQMSAGPLSHIKVVDLSRFAAGPYCAKLLADFGADVIKVEQPRTGDEARRKVASPDDPQAGERSALFLYVNTNKRGMTLGLDKEEGREVFRKLIADADILIEDRTPGEMDAWGLGYENLRQINPGLVVTSITPFGQTGPYRRYKAHHLNLFHASGQGYFECHLLARRRWNRPAHRCVQAARGHASGEIAVAPLRR